jgi:hypothetical protein
MQKLIGGDEEIAFLSNCTPLKKNLRADLEDHFESLGVGSVSGYKLWCYRNGLDTSLSKTPDQFQGEVALQVNRTEHRDPDLNKKHDPKRAEYLGRIFSGQLQNEKLSSVLHIIRKMHTTLAHDPIAQKAFARLILHTEKYSNLLWHQKAIRRYGNTASNTFLAGLGQLALHCNDWLRPLENWRPEHHQPRNQFLTLARHLLAKYDVPQFYLRLFSGQHQRSAPTAIVVQTRGKRTKHPHSGCAHEH